MSLMHDIASAVNALGDASTVLSEMLAAWPVDREPHRAIWAQWVEAYQRATAAYAAVLARRADDSAQQ